MAQQRETFDRVASLYDEVRPRVPDPAFAALWTRLGLSPGDTVVEVGCGTGQLTERLASRGARVVALEPGGALARICIDKTAGLAVTVVPTTFESWSPQGERCAAVAAAQAAHWIEPQTFLDRAWDALASDGRVGLLWHLDVSAGTGFWRATQPLFERYLPDAISKPPQTIPTRVSAYERAFEEDPRFTSRPRERWPWTQTFDAPTYRKLLMTHSPVLMSTTGDRQAFLDGHDEIIRRFDGRIERHYETVLIVGHVAAAESRP